MTADPERETRMVLILAQFEGSPIQNLLGGVEVEVEIERITDENRLPGEPAEATVRAHKTPIVAAVATVLAQLANHSPGPGSFPAQVEPSAPVDSSSGPRCCKITCPKPAAWVIHASKHFEDYTESCTEHVGELIEMGPIDPDSHDGTFRVWPIEQGISAS